MATKYKKLILAIVASIVTLLACSISYTLFTNASINIGIVGFKFWSPDDSLNVTGCVECCLDNSELKTYTIIPKNLYVNYCTDGIGFSCGGDCE